MRRFPHYLLAAALSLAAVTAPLAARAGAQTSDADKVTKLYQQKEATDAEQQAAKNQLANLQKQRQQLDSSLSSLEAQVAASNARFAAAQADADKFAALAADVQAKVDETVRQIDKAQADMRKSALLLYTQHDGGSNMLSLLTATDGSGTLVEGQHYLQRVSTKRRHDAVKVTKLKSDLEIQKAQIAEQKKAADDARAAAAAEKEQLDALIAQQEQSRAAAAANEQQTGTLVASLQAKQEAIEADLTAASNAYMAQLQGSPDTTPGPSGFIRPVPGPVTSPFGYRTDPVTGATAFHSGLDLGSPCGTPIKAAATGTVFQVVPEAASGGYGNMTIIKHGGNIATLYGHQSSIIVSPGQTVLIGQTIGYVGSTGKSTGCHLHWEVRVNGTPVNPAAYL
jgi:murein DD-endopeptidase MepM/ murein hydrolase activator NlpD